MLASHFVAAMFRPVITLEKIPASCFTEFSKNKLKFLNKGGTFLKKHCGAASVGVLQDNLVLSTELTM